jgi:hypothetical protein
MSHQPPCGTSLDRSPRTVGSRAATTGKVPSYPAMLLLRPRQRAAALLTELIAIAVLVSRRVLVSDRARAIGQRRVPVRLCGADARPRTRLRLMAVHQRAATNNFCADAWALRSRRGQSRRCDIASRTLSTAAAAGPVDFSTPARQEYADAAGSGPCSWPAPAYLRVRRPLLRSGLPAARAIPAPLRRRCAHGRR